MTMMLVTMTMKTMLLVAMTIETMRLITTTMMANIDVFIFSLCAGPSFAGEPAENPSSSEPRRVLRVVRRLRKPGG